MNSFQQGLSRYFSREELETISTITVGIGGAGGLGSNCAMNLVRSGFEQFVIADFDSIEPSNLNRQFFFQDQVGMKKVIALAKNLRGINPNVDVQVCDQPVTTDNVGRIFADCSVIVEAFDDPAAKKLFVETFSQTDRLIVAASGIAGCGDSDRIVTRKVNEKFYLVGDMVSASSAELPPYSPAVAIAAAKQADIILSHALREVRRNRREHAEKQ